MSLTPKENELVEKFAQTIEDKSELRAMGVSTISCDSAKEIIARIDHETARVETLTAEVERLQRRESELVDRLSCIYSSLEDMWLAGDFSSEFDENSDSQSTIVRHSLLTGEIWMIHKILAPLKRTAQKCFLDTSASSEGEHGNK